MIRSSSSVHGPLLMSGDRWLCQLHARRVERGKGGAKEDRRTGGGERAARARAARACVRACVRRLRDGCAPGCAVVSPARRRGTHRSRHCLPTRPGMPSAILLQFCAPWMPTRRITSASSCGGGQGGGWEEARRRVRREWSVRPRFATARLAAATAAAAPRRGRAARALDPRCPSHLGRPGALGDARVQHYAPALLAVLGRAADDGGHERPVALGAQRLERAAEGVILRAGRAGQGVDGGGGAGCAEPSTAKGDPQAAARRGSGGPFRGRRRRRRRPIRRGPGWAAPCPRARTSASVQSAPCMAGAAVGGQRRRLWEPPCNCSALWGVTER